MQITNCGRGIHKNEVKGVDQLKKNLPAEWFAFTNLDLAIGPGMAREIDVIMVTDKRVLIIDLKHWHGAITGADNRWFLDGVDMDFSPVAKVTEVARHLYALLKRELDKRPETKRLGVPKIDGLVVLTGKNDRSGIPATDRAKVLTAAELLKALSTDDLDRATFGNISPDILARPLVGADWKQHLTRFFNAGNNSPLKPGRRKFQRFVPEEHHVFEHPLHIYREYEAKEEGTPPSLGTLRLWDFEKVEDTRFQGEEGRAEIAGRERKVFHWLRDRSDTVDTLLLSPRTDDPTGGVRYWEVYDRRKRLKRLSDWVRTEKAALNPSGRIELARQFLSHLAELHRMETFHLDLGGHSIWLEAPTTVRLSHLFAARHPDVSSLGESRYHFLSSVQLPEDVIGGGKGNARRDVFLAAGAIHQILFGAPPANDPPDWNPGVDPDGTFSSLYDWFAEALDHDAANRFFDARSALEAFNKATVEHPTPREVQDGLERFRGKTRSQLALLARFPMSGEPLRESDRADVWRSMTGNDAVVVKMWKQAAWGDLEKEGKRILAFLERAADAMTDAPPGLPRVRAVFWLGDAFAVVQDWVEGPTLAEQVADASAPFAAPEVALDAVRSLESTVRRLHEAGYGHGDIKPENVVRDGSGGYTLIDALDFAPLADGELQNGAYSSGGDTFERDRSAVLKMASEILALSSLPSALGAAIERAMETCRFKEPRLSTLLPFSEAIDLAIAGLAAPAPASAPGGLRLTMSVRNAETGELEADEGRYYVRAYGRNGSGPASVHVRGAVEEIEFRLDTEGVPKSAVRRKIGQTSIAIVARHEIHSFPGLVAIVDSTRTDLGAVREWMQEPAIAGLLTGGPAANSEPTPAEDESVLAPEEEAEESITEEVAAYSGTAADEQVDVPLLWRELIDIERELTTEAAVVSDSAYETASGRHKVAIELESGAFDFDKNDRVTVQRQVKGGWRRIGELDVGKSLSTVAYVEVSHLTAPQRTALLEAGQRLRFVSTFEAESLRRRSDAVGRILAGQGRAGNLVSVFDPRSGAVPHSTGYSVDDAELVPYELNPDQAAAFRKIVAVRPVGMVQGPPGTGKTRFIAALAHYAITKGLARNVLLSSQSHEAVNTAAESLLKLFRKSGGDPSVLRVAINDDQVSDPIRPYHTTRVEQGFKDRFQATFNERLWLAGKSLGLPREVVDDCLVYEGSVTVCRRKRAACRALGQRRSGRAHRDGFFLGVLGQCRSVRGRAPLRNPPAWRLHASR